MRNHTSSDQNNLVVGRKPVQELFAQDPRRVESVMLQKGLQGKQVARIIDTCKANSIRYKFAPKQELEKLFPGNHQGFIAFTLDQPLATLDDVFEAAKTSPLPLIIALDKVQDTGNVGSLARTLYALGGAGIITMRHGGARLGGGAVKASAGALLKLPVCQVTNLSQTLQTAKEKGFFIYATHLDDTSENLFDINPAFPAILVLGNEEKGVRKGVADKADAKLKIPLKRKFDSLGVSQAGAIAMTVFAQAGD